MNFVKTQSEEVAETLRSAGYVELQKEGNFFVFVNNATENFSADIKQQLIYTDKLHF